MTTNGFFCSCEKCLFAELFELASTLILRPLPKLHCVGGNLVKIKHFFIYGFKRVAEVYNRRRIVPFVLVTVECFGKLRQSAARCQTQVSIWPIFYSMFFSPKAIFYSLWFSLLNKVYHYPIQVQSTKKTFSKKL